MVLASAGASAELIKGDWKSVNDNLSVVDTETGVEWLSLTQTHGMSLNQAETLLNSTFDGWRLPTSQEVLTLMRNTFTSHTIESSPLNYNGYLGNAESQQFTEMLGSVMVGGKDKYSLGYIKDNSTGTNLVSGSVYKLNSAIELYSNSISGGGSDTSHYAYGVFLVSDGGTTLASINNPELNANNVNNTVPLPATLGLLSLAIAGLSFRRKEK
jgi:hypothetical protein